MNIALWILQALLALAFLGAGVTKIITPIPELLANGMAFVEHAPVALVRFIGVAEFAGALGLILPSLLKIKPKLTPIAAGALALVMTLAVLTHLVMSDIPGAIPSLVLGALSAFVAWGRWSKAPIQAR